MLESKSAWGLWFSHTTVILATLVVVALGFTQAQEHYDDAYITYRYAQNLATGQGFVYNPGEAVLGITAPLFGLVLAAVGRLGLDLPRASHLLGILSWAVSVPLMYRIGSATRNRRVGLLASVMVATSALFLQAIGMETNFVIALALGAFCLYFAGHTRLAFLVAGLATLARPDTALVALILAAAYIWEKRALPWREALVYGLVLLPWLAFSQITYGSIIPNSFFAKAGQGQKPFLGGTELGTYGMGLVHIAAEYLAVSKMYLLVAFFALVGLVNIVWVRPRYALIVIWGAFYALSYIVLAVVPFPWYYPPIYPALALLVATGIATVARFVGRVPLIPHAAEVAIAILCLLAVLPQARVLAQVHQEELSPYYRGYQQAGMWLRDNTPPEASVALIEIGIIGFVSERRVVDTMGLISPDITKHLYSWYQTVAYAIMRYWPDYAVALEGTAWDAITWQGWFRDAYVPEVTILSAGPGSRTITIYRRHKASFEQADDRITLPEVTAGEIMQLSAIRVQSAVTEAGGFLRVSLHFKALAAIQNDYQVELQLVDIETGNRWRLGQYQPMGGGNPTFLWQPDESINDMYVLSLPPDLPTGTFLLEVGIIDAASGQALSFRDATGQSVPHVAGGPIVVGKHPAAQIEAMHDLPATFGDSLGLLGYDLERTDYSPGESLPLTLYWSASQHVRDDFTVFVHIVDASGRLVAQEDHYPLGGNFATSLLLPGVTLRDPYRIVLPPDLAPGEYLILVGLYKFETGERLPIYSEMAETSDNALRLARLVLR